MEIFSIPPLEKKNIEINEWSTWAFHEASMLAGTPLRVLNLRFVMDRLQLATPVSETRIFVPNISFRCPNLLRMPAMVGIEDWKGVPQSANTYALGISMGASLCACQHGVSGRRPVFAPAVPNPAGVGMRTWRTPAWQRRAQPFHRRETAVESFPLSMPSDRLTQARRERDSEETQPGWQPVST